MVHRRGTDPLSRKHVSMPSLTCKITRLALNLRLDYSSINRGGIVPLLWSESTILFCEG